MNAVKATDEEDQETNDKGTDDAPGKLCLLMFDDSSSDA